CIALGLSPFVMQVTEGILQICFNVQLRFYGEMVGGNMDTIALGTMTILSSVMQFSFLPLSGLTQGAQPIVSYNFGAGNSERVKKTFKYELISAFAYASVIWVLVMAFPSLFAKIFVNSEDVFAGQIIELTSTALRIYMAVSLLFSMQMVCQQTFVSLGKAKISLFLAVLRKIVLLIPLIFILPAIFPSQAIIMIFTAEPIADIIAVIITVSVFFAKFKSIMAECDKNKCSIASDSATVTLESQTSIK
ncbi:MAG: MATE family efflux transporter, partial [Clostridia bacterium]